MPSSARLIALLLFCSLIGGIDGYRCWTWFQPRHTYISQTEMVKQCVETCSELRGESYECDKKKMLYEHRLMNKYHSKWICKDMGGYCFIKSWILYLTLGLVFGLPFLFMTIVGILMCCRSRRARKQKKKEEEEQCMLEQQQMMMYQQRPHQGYFPQPSHSANPHGAAHVMQRQGPPPYFTSSPGSTQAQGGDLRFYYQPRATSPAAQPFTAQSSVDNNFSPGQPLVGTFTLYPAPSSQQARKSDNSTSSGRSSRRVSRESSSGRSSKEVSKESSGNSSAEDSETAQYSTVETTQTEESQSSAHSPSPTNQTENQPTTNPQRQDPPKAESQLPYPHSSFSQSSDPQPPYFEF